MTDVTKDRTGELLRELFRLLMAAPQGLQASEALARLREAVPATEHELSSYPSGGGPRYDKNVRFATVDCVKAGWMIKERGVWTVTPEGASAYERHRAPGDFYRAATRAYRAWQVAQRSPEDASAGPLEETLQERPLEDAEDPAQAASKGSPEEAPDPQAREAALTLEQAEEQAWAQVHAHLTHMPPYELQQLVAALLGAMGYEVAWIAPPGKDGGVDILAHRDPIGATPPRIKVQVKRVRAPVSVDGLRAFMAVLADADVGLFVSTGGFTRDALAEARTQEKRRITLIDMSRLFELWVKHYAKLDDAAKLLLPLKPVYFLAQDR